MEAMSNYYQSIAKNHHGGVIAIAEEIRRYV